MKFNITENGNVKIGIFSDLHIGVSSDSAKRLQQTVKCVEWIIRTFKENGVKWVFFCGDFFHSRYSVNVNTLNLGIKIMQMFSNRFERVFMIAGNHDTYYKNSNDVNSVSFMEKISRNNNVTVICSEPYFISVGGKSIGLYPWDYNMDGLVEIDGGYSIPDYGFGHFEMNGKDVDTLMKTNARYCLGDLFGLGHILFSGHYHDNHIYPKSMKTDEDQYLYMIGAPLQMTFGDVDREKKILVFDPSNGKYDEFENTVNARFMKISYKDMNNNRYGDGKLKETVSGNYIKFLIDDTYDMELITKYMDMIKDAGADSVEIEYLITAGNELVQKAYENAVNSETKSNREYLLDYIDTVVDVKSKEIENIDRGYLKDLAEKYYSSVAEKEQVGQDED